MVHIGDMVIIAISAGLALGVVIACVVYFGIRWHKKNAHLRRCANENSATTLPIRTNGLDTSIDLSASLSSSISVRGSDRTGKKSQFPWFSHRSKDRFMTESGLPRYSYKDVQKATQNFTIILGQGSFGAVYKATMAADEVFAVKVLASDSKQGENEFHTEVSLLGRLHHRNLVNLVGYSVDKGQRMLIYEFMSNGSLANLLYKQEERALTWEERVQIALDISHGVEYLHDGAVPPVIHRDLKSANILLDRSMRAKVADFGLSKEEAFDGRNSGLKGTYGYIDPAYVSTSKFTTKSDVYSFGIILFELITAIHPHQNLMEYINLAGMSEDGVDEIIDERMAGGCDLEEVRNIASIAHKCLQRTPKKRPSIREVSQSILKIKQRQLIKEDSMSFSGDVLGTVASRIAPQQVELRRLASIDEKSTA